MSVLYRVQNYNLFLPLLLPPSLCVGLSYVIKQYRHEYVSYAFALILLPIRRELPLKCRMGETSLLSASPINERQPLHSYTCQEQEVAIKLQKQSENKNTTTART